MPPELSYCPAGVCHVKKVAEAAVLSAHWFALVCFRSLGYAVTLITMAHLIFDTIHHQLVQDFIRNYLLKKGEMSLCVHRSMYCVSHAESLAFTLN
jgi:hypothetical protein